MVRSVFAPFTFMSAILLETRWCITTGRVNLTSEPLTTSTVHSTNHYRLRSTKRPFLELCGSFYHQGGMTTLRLRPPVVPNYGGNKEAFPSTELVHPIRPYCFLNELFV